MAVMNQPRASHRYFEEVSFGLEEYLNTYAGRRNAQCLLDTAVGTIVHDYNKNKGKIEN